MALYKTFRVIEPYNDGSGLVYDYCGFDFVGELEDQLVAKRHTVLATVNKKSATRSSTPTSCTPSSKISRIAPVLGSILIPAGSALHNQYLLPIGITGDSLAFDRIYDLGKRTNTDDQQVLRRGAGLQGRAVRWDYNASYTCSQSEAKTSIAGYPGARAVSALRASGRADRSSAPASRAQPPRRR